MRGGEHFISNKTDGTEFREIILAHLKRILEMSSTELRQMKKVIFNPNGQQEVHEEDTRESYIQSVEALAIVLIPYFDDEMEGVWKKSEKIINAWNYELEEIFSKEFKEIKEKLKIDSMPIDYYSRLRVSHAKIIFKELNLLLKRQDYLKDSIFGE